MSYTGRLNIIRRQIMVSGRVSNVGFRAYVLTLAKQHSLSGHVKKREPHIVIEVEGREVHLTQFIRSLKTQTEAGFVIERLSVLPIALQGGKEFLISA